MISQFFFYVHSQIKNINSIPQYPNFLSIFNYMFKLRNRLASITDLEPNYSRRQTTLSENGDPCHCFWPVNIDDLKKRVWKIIMCGMSGDTELHTGRRNSSMLARHLGIHLPSKGDQKRHFNDIQYPESQPCREFNLFQINRSAYHTKLGYQFY